MNKGIIKGEEKCLSQDCQDCELGGRFFMCNERMNRDIEWRLEQMIEACKSVGGEQDFIANTDRILTVILAFYCLGIITYDKVKDYIKRLHRGVK